MLILLLKMKAYITKHQNEDWIQQQKDSQNDNKSESVVEQNKENEAFVQNHSEEKPQQEQVELEKHASENNQTLHSKSTVQ